MGRTGGRKGWSKIFGAVVEKTNTNVRRVRSAAGATGTGCAAKPAAEQRAVVEEKAGCADSVDGKTPRERGSGERSCPAATSARGENPPAEANGGHIPDRLAILVARLPLFERETYLLAARDGFANGQIAHRLGLGESEVRRHLAQALLRIAAGLASEDG